MVIYYSLLANPSHSHTHLLSLASTHSGHDSLVFSYTLDIEASGSGGRALKTQEIKETYQVHRAPPRGYKSHSCSCEEPLTPALMSNPSNSLVQKAGLGGSVPYLG